LAKTAYVFLAPALFFVILFLLVPTFFAVYLSFNSWNGFIGVTPDFKGLTNYLSEGNYEQINKAYVSIVSQLN
jgi:multiple sugar transport system permease protein